MARQLIKTSSAPVGEILIFPKATIPSTFLACQGQAVSRTTYSKLFSVIGTLYGVGDGVNTFNLPNYQGRFLRGLGGNSAVLGTYQTDLNKQHTHTQTAHNHTQSSHNHTQNAHGHSGSTNSDSHTHGGGVLVNQVLYSGSARNPLVSTTGTRHPYMAMGSDSHSHTATGNDTAGVNVAATATNIAATATNQNSGGVETRPKNAAVVYCIRY